MITIVLAEDHKLVREGLKSLLTRNPTLRIVGEAADGRKAVELVQRLKPAILLLDLMLPGLNGIDALRELANVQATKVIVVSMHADDARVLEALRYGAAGYVLKESSAKELLDAIRAVVAGRVYLSASLSPFVLNVSVEKRTQEHSDICLTLSSRERLVLQLGAEGRTSAQIGKQLSISRRTVETHRANLMNKLSPRSQTDLVRFAVRKNLVSP